MTDNSDFDVAALAMSGVSDVTFSADYSRLYAAKADGDIDVFDIATGDKLMTWDVGQRLGGITLSEDGDFLLVTETRAASGTSVLYRIDTATGAKEVFSRRGGGFIDVEIVDENTAIVTGGLLKFDLATGAFTPLEGGVFYSGTSVLVEDDGYLLIAEPGTSNGPLFLYGDTAGAIVAAGDSYSSPASGFNWGSQAVSEEAGLVLQFIYHNTINVYDLNLDFRRTVNVGGLVDGLVFDDAGEFAYAYMIDQGVVAKIDVATWARVDEYQVGTSNWHNSIGYGSQLLISDDGNFISVLSNATGKLQVIDLTVGHQTFNGTSGADVLEGFGGNDVYVVNNRGDVVIEAAGKGDDRIVASIDHILAANVEQLTLAGDAVRGIGNELANQLSGNGLDNILSGMVGDDRVTGLAGNDRIQGGDGDDTLLGGVGDDVLQGDVGNDVLDGGAGSDVMTGGAGDDEFVFDSTTDRALEGYDAGVDLVRSSVSVTLSANIENLVLTGSAIRGAGNLLVNQLIGNAAANLLDGSGGVDRMVGGAGNDIYVVDSRGDQTIEAYSAAGGIDRVEATVTTILASGVEHLLLTGEAAIGGSGNGLANRLTGNSAANLLDGKAGADVMIGGGGNDVYHVDALGDRVVEVSSTDGFDRVVAAVTFTLGANVEALALAGGAAINGRGNVLDNTIAGNAAANRLTGGAGDDVLSAGNGNDWLFGGEGQDRLAGGNGADVYHFASTLDPANVDRIIGYAAASDTIALDRTFFAAFERTGAISAESFRIGAEAVDADDRIIFDRASGSLFYDSDGAGGADAILFATIAPGAALTSLDFVIVA